MGTPVDERTDPMLGPPHNPPLPHGLPQRNSDEDGTVFGEGSYRHEGSIKDGKGDAEASRFLGEGLQVNTNNNLSQSSQENLRSPTQTREESHRLEDDLKLLQVERQISHQIENRDRDQSNARSTIRDRSRVADRVIDDFDVATNPLHERTQVYKPPEHPDNKFAAFIKKVHTSSWLVRYIFYITPLTLLILIPLLIGSTYKPAIDSHLNVGGVQLFWFCIWLEIVWLTLWAGRLTSKLLPWPFGLIMSLFTNNAKKWRDMFRQLEFPCTLFLWMLAVEISFLPIMRKYTIAGLDADGQKHLESWTRTMNKVIISFFVLTILNFIEKIIIQLIAISFHLRTYQDRIELNKFQIASLVKLYTFSKVKIAMEDSDFEAPSGNQPSSGQMTPGQVIEKAQKNANEAFKKFGDISGKIAGDFTGRAVRNSQHPNQVVLALLATPGGSQILARRLYRTFAREETETVYQDDLKHAFENDDEADAAFSMFDKDMNGDISMEELEAVCVEIGRERKAITASLKDLDSVVGKLDNILMFMVLVIFILVFISLISTAASGVLTSAGSAVLALSWLFSATAQEFLQSIIFVFVKHPFDVGDRVVVYGNTGSMLKGDEYFVKEISLLYTEFKKMEGNIVQAPNSYLNTLFILNQRRSGGVAEALSMVFKFGTTLEQIEGLRNKLIEFVKAEKREFQGNVLTELREITEAHSITVNIIFFYKTNWQNEALRLQRRNKFLCALMVSMKELDIEGPRMRYPGMRESYPMYMSQMPYNQQNMGYNGSADFPYGAPKPVENSDFVNDNGSIMSRADVPLRQTSVSRTRPRGESLAQMGRRMDFSLGMTSAGVGGDIIGDVYNDREAARVPKTVVTAASPGRERSTSSARTTSRMSNISGIGSITRRGTEPARRTSGSLHRNRFFGHRGQDVEMGMAGIPEDPSSTDNGGNSGRIDPRSGIISPAAMRSSIESMRAAATRPRGYSQPPQNVGAHLGDNLPHLPDFSRPSHYAPPSASEDKPNGKTQ